MTLSTFRTIPVIVLLFHVINAETPLTKDGVSGESDGSEIQIPKRSTTIIATLLVVFSCAPIMFVPFIYFLNRCKARLHPESDENEAATLRATIIANLLREDNENCVLRRAVLEKFFSDVSKCFTAKDCLTGHSVINLPNLSPSPPLKNDEEDMTGARDKINMYKPDKSDPEVETPDTPNTHVSDNTDNDSNFGYDEHELYSPPTSRRSLIHYPKEFTDAAIGFQIIPPTDIQKCEVISEGQGGGDVYNKIDMLERGDHPLQEILEDNACSICLEPYEKGEFIIESKHCPHKFHKTCILLWLEKNDACPCCRKSMITEEEVKTLALSFVGTQHMFSSANIP